MNQKKITMVVGIVLGLYASSLFGAIASPNDNTNNLVAALEMRDKG